MPHAQERQNRRGAVCVIIPDFRDREGKWVRTHREGGLKGTQYVTVADKLYRNMLARCTPGYKTAAYRDCKNKFADFQEFAEWAQTQVGYYQPGWQLDKDLLCPGNRTYSRDFCTFLPPEVNLALARGSKPNSLGKGVHPSGEKYTAQLSHNGRPHYIGTFNTVGEAREAYAQARRKKLSTLAEKYRESLDSRAYYALLCFPAER